MDKNRNNAENGEEHHLCVIFAVLGAIVGGIAGYQIDGFSGVLKYGFAGALAGFIFVAFWPWSIFM